MKDRERDSSSPRTSALGAPFDRDMLPEFLVTQGQASSEEIAAAIQEQRETGRFLGEILADHGILSTNNLVLFLVKYCKIPYLSLLDYMIEEPVLSLVPADICWKYHLLPLDKLGKSLTIAMVNPLNQEALKTVRDLCPGYKVKPILCDHKEFEAVADKLLGRRDGHDEETWAHISFLAESDAVNPMVQQRNVLAHLTRKATRKTASGEPAPASGKAAQTKTGALADTNMLLRSIFQEKAPAEKSGNEMPLKDARAATAQDEGRTHQTQADTIVSNFRSPEELLQKVTDVMINSMHETYELLTRKIPIFAGLSAEDVARLYAEGTVSFYESGDDIPIHDLDLETFFVILSGKVEVNDADDSDTVLQREEIIGITRLPEHKKASVKIKAVENTSLLALQSDAVRGSLPPDVSVQLLMNMVMSLSGQLKFTRGQLFCSKCAPCMPPSPGASKTAQ